MLIKTLLIVILTYSLYNGGSASDSSHFAAELTGKFKSKNRKPFKCIALIDSVTNITAISNDFSYKEVL